MRAIRIALLATMFAILACSTGGQTGGTEATAAAPPEATSAPPTARPTARPASTPRPATNTPAPSELELRTRALVQSMADEGYLSSTDGEFVAIPDFTRIWAKLNWYQWWNTGYAPKDFLISAHTEWESRSNKADWWNSGCGFVFRERGEDDHFLAYLGMDGWVYLSKVTNGKHSYLSYKAYGTVSTPEGKADVIMIVEDKSFHYFVNGERVLSHNYIQDIGGNLGLTLLSGTNKGFGTRCKMEDIALWVIE